MTDPDTIETTLSKVQSGELSPTAAVELMLGRPSDPEPTATAGESIAELIDRLGAPPPTIVESWCHQLGWIASQHEQRSGAALPPIDTRHWSLTPAGQLAWRGSVFAPPDDARPPSSQSLGQIEAFRRAMLAARRTPPQPAAPHRQEHRHDRIIRPIEAPPIREAADRPSPPTESPLDRSAVTSQPQRAHQRLPFRGKVVRCKAVAIAGAALGGLVIIAVLYHRSQPSPQRVDDPNAQTSQAPSASQENHSPHRHPPATSNASSPSPADPTLESLATIEQLRQPASDLAGDASYSLPDLLPPAADFGLGAETILPPDLPSDTRRPPTEAIEPPPASLAIDQAIDQAIESDQPSPDELLQQTRWSASRSVELDPGQETLEPVTLSATHLEVASLSFPTEIPLSLMDHPTAWQIRNLRNGLVVATIANDDAGLQLQWTDGEAKSSNAATLAHGRIRSQSGETIYLRPLIEADPWPLRFDQPDVMPSWNLGTAIPPRVTRIAVELEIPEDVELAWIEPVASESVRQTRGLAVLSPQDGETVSLGLRFDIRCGRKLSCRIRVAGRLAPTMPWEVVSHDRLDQFANHLTQQAMLVSNEANRLASVYEIAGPSGRKILNAKRDRNDAWGETIRTAADRVAELQGLIADVEAAATLHLRVWVEWPEGEQTVFLAGGSQDDGDR